MWLLTWCTTGAMGWKTLTTPLSISPLSRATSYSPLLWMGGGSGEQSWGCGVPIRPRSMGTLGLKARTDLMLLCPHVYSVSNFASMYAKKLGLSEKVLQKTLWGDFFLNSKTKRIFKGAQVGLECLSVVAKLRRPCCHPPGHGEETFVCAVRPGQPLGCVQGNRYGEVCTLYRTLEIWPVPS